MNTPEAVQVRAEQEAAQTANLQQASIRRRRRSQSFFTGGSRSVLGARAGSGTPATSTGGSGGSALSGGATSGTALSGYTYNGGWGH